MAIIEYKINNLYHPVRAYREAQILVGCGSMALAFVDSDTIPYLSPDSATVWKKTSTGEEVLLKRRGYNDPHVAVKFITA